METALTILAFAIMFGGMILVNGVFNKPIKPIKKESWTPIGIDQYGNVMMKKDIDIKS